MSLVLCALISKLLMHGLSRRPDVSQQRYPLTSFVLTRPRILIKTTGDLSDREGYDFDQLFAIAKVQVRTSVQGLFFSLITVVHVGLE